VKSQAKRNKLQADTRLAKVEFHKREGTYRKGMNVDDPYGEVAGGDSDNEDARKPAARPRRMTNEAAAKKYCEYCGIKGHATVKSKKCIAVPGSAKKYRRDDGSLLTLLLAPPVPAEEDDDDAFVTSPTILDDDHEIDCHEND
jgi:hypothetical protein